MTGTEFFWGLAINWLSSAGEGGLKQLFAGNRYLEEVRAVYYQTQSEYEKLFSRSNSSEKKDKYPFYEAQAFLEACLQFHFYEDLDAEKVFKEIEKDKRILPAKEKQIHSFLQLLQKNIRANADLKTAFLAEHYQQEIFTISQQLKEIQKGISTKRNEITINGEHNIVLQDIENVKELIISLDKRKIEQTLEQKNALKAYQAEIAKEYSKPIWGEDKMSLKDTYIEQRFGIYRECFRYEPDKSTFIAVDKSLHGFVNEWISHKEGFRNQDIKVRNTRMILLLGQPGQGKSSFCKRLMYEVFHQAELQNQPIFRINFREITDTEALMKRPLPFLREFIEKEKGINLEDAYFRNCLLVLDGLDELKIRDNLGTQVENQFLENLATSLESNFTMMRVLLTSRYQVAIEKFKNDFLILNISLLSVSEMQAWLNKYKVFYPDAFLTAETLTAFQKIPHLEELCTQPILLYMLAQVHTAAQPIGEKTNKATLYEQLFSHVVERKWAKEGQLSALKDVRQADIRCFLQEIGFAIFQSNTEYLHKTEIEKMVAQHPRLKDMNNLLSKETVRGLMMAFYIQEKQKAAADEDRQEDKSNYGIEFMHKSLQEFLAAEKIWEQIQDLLEQNRYHEFTINEGAKCLEVFYKCFHKQFLTPNIRTLLLEIIANESAEKKANLAQRMEKFFAYCLEKDFLYQYNLATDHNPIAHSLNVFYGFWCVFAIIKMKRNFLNDEMKISFARLLSYLMKYMTEAILDLSDTDLSWMDLSNSNLTSVNLSYTYSKSISISHTNLKESNLRGAYLLNSDLSYSDLSYSDLGDSYLSTVNLNATNLRYADLRRVDLSGAKNLTFPQLSQAKTLYKVRGLPQDLEKELRKKCPHLFEEV